VYVSQSEQMSGMQAGADAYMVAPVDPSALVATLDHLIQARPVATH
jgi:DNA-binding response OmpR family regulator